MIGLALSQDLWMLYLFAAIYGFSNGGFAPSTTALIANTFGIENIGAIMGVLNIGWGIGAAVGPAVGGLVYDTLNSYDLAFLVGAGAMLMVTFCIASIRRERDHDK